MYTMKVLPQPVYQAVAAVGQPGPVVGAVHTDVTHGRTELGGEVLQRVQPREVTRPHRPGLLISPGPPPAGVAVHSHVSHGAFDRAALPVCGRNQVATSSTYAHCFPPYSLSLGQSLLEPKVAPAATASAKRWPASSVVRFTVVSERRVSAISSSSSTLFSKLSATAPARVATRSRAGVRSRVIGPAARSKGNSPLAQCRTGNNRGGIAGGPQDRIRYVRGANGTRPPGRDADKLLRPLCSRFFPRQVLFDGHGGDLVDQRTDLELVLAKEAEIVGGGEVGGQFVDLSVNDLTGGLSEVLYLDLLLRL
jgi:hypothetical protein